MNNLMQTYRKLIEKKEKSILLLFTVCLLIQKLSYSAIIEVTLEGATPTVYAHIFMSVLPEEKVSGIQLECAYNMQDWELVSVFPGENLYASEKQLQTAPGYNSLRILIIGFNNYPIANGELFTLQFNALTEGVDKLGFHILSAKLSSPQALPVNGTVNNKEEEPPVNSDSEKESNLIDTSNANSSIETTPQTYTKLPNVTNSINEKPNIREVEREIVTPTYSQHSSPKSYSPFSTSGYFPETNNPYSRNRKQQENTKKEIQKNTANPINVFQKPPITERQNTFNSRTVLTNQAPNLHDKNVKTTPVFRNARAQQAKEAHTLDNSTYHSLKLSTNQNNIATHPVPGNVKDTLNNTHLALNVSNLSSIRGRSNECTQTTPTSLLIHNTSQKENILTLLLSIIITVLMLLILLPMVLKKRLFPIKKKQEK